jgi:hypothetical protein
MYVMLKSNKRKVWAEAWADQTNFFVLIAIPVLFFQLKNSMPMDR